MIRKKNKYKRPLKPFEAGRIKEENELKKRFGLKNKREIWKTQAKVTYFRGRAKALAKRPLEEQEALLNKLRALGLKVETLSDVLDLKVENILQRRLPTVVTEKKLADTIKQARQKVVHKKIMINGKVVNSPSYLVSVSDENSITERKKERKAKPKQEEPAEQVEETESINGETQTEESQ